MLVFEALLNCDSNVYVCVFLVLPNAKYDGDA